jgi:hypothetical protein
MGFAIQRFLARRRLVLVPGVLGPVDNAARGRLGAKTAAKGLQATA